MGFSEIHKPSDAHSDDKNKATTSRSADFLRLASEEGKRPATQQENEIPVGEDGKPLAKLQLNSEREYLRGGMNRDGDRASTSGGSWEKELDNSYDEWMAVRNYENLFYRPDDMPKRTNRPPRYSGTEDSDHPLCDSNLMNKYLEYDEFKDHRPYIEKLREEMDKKIKISKNSRKCKDQHSSANKVFIALMEFDGIHILNDLEKLGIDNSITVLMEMHRLMKIAANKLKTSEYDRDRRWVILEGDGPHETRKIASDVNVALKQTMHSLRSLEKIDRYKINYMIQIAIIAAYKNTLQSNWEEMPSRQVLMTSEQYKSGPSNYEMIDHAFNNYYKVRIPTQDVTNAMRDEVRLRLAGEHHLMGRWCITLPPNDWRDKKEYIDMPKDVIVINSNIGLALSYEGTYHSELFHLRAQGLAAMGRYDDALEHCDKAMKLTQDQRQWPVYNGPIFKTYAMVHKALGNLDKAKSYLNMAIQQGDNLYKKENLDRKYGEDIYKYFKKLRKEGEENIYQYIERNWNEDKKDIQKLIKTLDESEHPQRNTPTTSSSEERQKLQQEFDRQLNEVKKRHEEELKQERSKLFAANRQFENVKRDHDQAYKERDQALIQLEKLKEELKQERSKLYAVNRQFENVRIDRDKAYKERDQTLIQLEKFKQERDQTLIQLEKFKQERDQVLAREKNVKILEKNLEIKEKRVNLKRQKGDLIYENLKSTLLEAFDKHEFKEELLDKTEEILGEFIGSSSQGAEQRSKLDTPNELLIKKVQHLFTEKMKTYARSGMSWQEFTQEFLASTSSLTENDSIPEISHKLVLEEIKTHTEIVNNIEKVLLNSHSEVGLLIEMQSCYETMGKSKSNRKDLEEFAQKFELHAKQLMTKFHKEDLQDKVIERIQSTTENLKKDLRG